MDEAIVRDFLECAEPSAAPALWAWIQATEDRYPAVKHTGAGDGGWFRRPKDQGYAVASALRTRANLGSEPIRDLDAFIRQVENISLRYDPHNHIPSRNVSAFVGWTNPATAVVAAPSGQRSDNQRFLLARGLYLALTGCAKGARLVTRASTWDQQAGRAFAAELLAPQEALALEVNEDMELDEREEAQQRLADRYQVSTEVIRLQLYNQGVWR